MKIRCEATTQRRTRCRFPSVPNGLWVQADRRAYPLCQLHLDVLASGRKVTWW